MIDERSESTGSGDPTASAGGAGGGASRGDTDAAVRALDESLSDDDRTFLDQLADGLHERRLGSAAVFLLESVKPLGWLGSQLLLLFRPMVAVVFHDPVRWDRVQRLLEHREAVELLLRRLEARY